MTAARRAGRINVRAVLTLALAAALLTVGLVAAHSVRKGMIARSALAAGRAAFERGEWPTACREFNRYLERVPNDVEILAAYAQAQLAMRPLKATHLGSAAGAYRRLLRLEPGNQAAYETLAALYTRIGNYDELAYIAARRLEHVSDDPSARLWKAQALIAKREPAAARQELEALAAQLEGREEKRPEFVEACGLLSSLAAADNTPSARADAQRWLDRAVEYDPSSAIAYVWRGRFLRLTAPAASPEHGEAHQAARADLERAASLETQDPRALLMLSQEWAAHGEVTRAAAALEASNRIPAEVLKLYFLDPDDWLTRRFIQAADVALRRQAPAEGATLADQALTTLTERRARAAVLPAAVEVYAAAGRLDDARRCLREYEDLAAQTGGGTRFDEAIALLKVTVARAAARPYDVIGILAPLAEGNPADARVFRLLAEVCVETGQTRRAIAALQKYLARQPHDAEARHALTRQLLAAGDWDAARQAAGEPAGAADFESAALAVEADVQVVTRAHGRASAAELDTLGVRLAALRAQRPQHVRLRMLQAALAAYRGDKTQAERELRQALEECTDALPAAMMLARLYADVQRTDDLVRVCREAADQHSEDATPWLVLAELLEKQGQVAETRRALETGRDRVTDATARKRLEAQLGVHDLLHGARQAGVQRLQQVVHDGQALTAVRVQAASLLLDLPEIARAPDATQGLIEQLKALEDETHGIVWRLHQARVWLRAANWREKARAAQELLEQATQADPGWDAAAAALGELHERLGRASEAEATYRKALAANASAYAAAERLVALLDRQQRFADAREVLTRFEPGTPGVLERRVALAAGAGDLAEALDALRLKVAGDAADVAARVALGRLEYEEAGDVPRALRYLDEAEALAGGDWTVTHARAAILLADGQAEAARKCVDALVERHPSLEAYWLRARFLVRVGEPVLAEQDFTRLTEFAERPEGWQLLASFYEETGRIDDAIRTWERAVEQHGDNRQWQASLVSARLHRGGEGDIDRAETALHELEAETPDEPEVLWLRALLTLRETTPEAVGRAEQLLQRVVELDPAAPSGYLKLAELAMQRGDHAAAREWAVRGLGANPNQVDLLLARGKAELALGNLPAARATARLALQMRPGDADAALLLTDAALPSGDAADRNEALSALARAIEKHETHEALRVSEARLLVALGRAGDALGHLEAFRQAQPNHVGTATLLTLAELHRGQGNVQIAERYVAEARTRDPQSPAVLQVRVLWLGLQQDWDALAALLRGERPDPPFTVDVLASAGAYLAASDQTAHRTLAADVLGRALERANGRPASLRLDLANLLYRVRATERAMQACRDVLAAEPENVRALNDLAWILAEARREYPEALQLADRGLRVEPDNLHLLDTRGAILMHTPGGLARARQDFERCVELVARRAAGTAEHARALAQVGRAYLRLGETEAAQNCVRQALEIDRRTGAFVAEERAELERALKRPGAS